MAVDKLRNGNICIYEWLRMNSALLFNGGSYIGATAVTSALGFVYWWAAARWFQPQAVGLSSATISAMTLIGTISILGFGTLLVGELPRQAGKEGSLISAALITVGVVGGGGGIVFSGITPLVSPDLRVLSASIPNILLFAAGVSLTAITLVLDPALIGLLQGGLYFWRNTLFALVKLAALFVISLWLTHDTGLAIYATWAIGNALSLLLLAGFVFLKRRSLRSACWPEWRLLRKLRGMALQHHALNLALRAPAQILPILVTMLLSVTANAWFYVSWMLASFVFIVPIALTMVLYAAVSRQPTTLAHKARLTLGLALAASILATCILFLVPNQLLGLFGHIYAEQAASSLRILTFGAFPTTIKYHYATICRLEERIARATLPMIAGCLLEVGGAALGALLGGLPGLSLGWLAGACIETAFMVPTVCKAIRFTATVTDRYGANTTFSREGQI